MIGVVLKRLVSMDAVKLDSDYTRVTFQFELVDSDHLYSVDLDYHPEVVKHVYDLRTLFDQQRAALTEDSHTAWDEAVTAFFNQ